MDNFPHNLLQKLEYRKQNNAFRKLKSQNILIDFASNDYLGFAKNETIFNQTHQYLLEKNIKTNGATGSRLLSGNHDLYPETEDFIAKFHNSETALISNSGYDANVGFFSSVPQRSDIILYDELCHASIRDGISMSKAKSFKFNHNDYENLEIKITKYKEQITNNITIYIVTESVFSMDGDCPKLEEIVKISEKYNCYLIVDEAHAVGVFGNSGEGLVQNLGLEKQVFARIVTFGKGIGSHGAAILGNQNLKDYLINFSRSFIYTTALSPHSVASILFSYKYMINNNLELNKLRENIVFFNQQKNFLGLKKLFVYSKSSIQCAIIPGNEKVISIALFLNNQGFDVKPILAPTVPEGQERLRICLHAYNTEKEILELLQNLSKSMF
jgi:8-amino-7-oxononanoate synthase